MHHCAFIMDMRFSMRPKPFHLSWTFPLLVVFLLVACGCSGNGSNSYSVSGGTTYEIAPGFREFYNSLGGENVLGAGISQSFPYEKYECQYTVNALLCLNPVQSGSGRFALYPLGAALNVREQPVENPESISNRVVNGYPIYEEFFALYDSFGGPQYVGNPLTQARLNYAQQRIEQYFENVGFYRNFSDPAGTVNLLAYGAASCDERCNYRPGVDSLLLTSPTLETDLVFTEGLEKLGDSSIFGSPLTQAYLATDGAQEQVYQNAVIYSEPGSSIVRLRPISTLVGMPTTEPGQKIYTNQNGMVFYSVKGVLGYHVPIIFDDFITAHGGTKTSGNPISEVSEVQSGLYRQCFENYCLDYSPGYPEGQQIQLTPLGNLYLEKIRSSVAVQQNFILSPETVEVRVTELYKQLPASQSQSIALTVIRRADQQALEGLESELLIVLPDGSVYKTKLAATASDGTSSILVPAFNDIPNGSILTYQVCLKGGVSQPICAGGSYLVWTNP
jgi:hypothetical protein